MAQIVRCSACSAKLQIPAGTLKAKCPKCGQILAVRAGGPAAGESKSPSQGRASATRATVGGSGGPQTAVKSKPAAQKTIRCPGCQTQLKVPASAAGKTVRCPKCSQSLRVPSAKPKRAPAPTSVPAGGFAADDPFGSLPPQPATPTFSAAASQPALPPANPFSSPIAAANRAGGNQQPYRPPAAVNDVRRSGSQAGWQSWLSENPKTLKLAAIVAAASFVLSVIPFLGMLVFALVAISYVAIQTAGGIWLVVVAFQEDVVQGLLYIFVPFYALFYLITRWDRSRVPFMLCMMSVLAFFCSFAGFMIGTIAFGALVGGDA